MSLPADKITRLAYENFAKAEVEESLKLAPGSLRRGTDGDHAFQRGRVKRKIEVAQRRLSTKERRGDQSARIMAEKRETIRDIGEISKIKNIAERRACERDLIAFMVRYTGNVFYLPFSRDHVVVVKKIEQALLTGGQFAEAMPRGSGKTAMCSAAALWAMLYGHRRYLVIIGAEQTHAQKIMEGVMLEVSTNNLLLDDFPELCCSVRHIDGIAQRASGQLYKGVRTHIRWNKGQIKCPIIEGAYTTDGEFIKSQCAGSIIQPKGLSSAIRGLHQKLPDGSILRPDFALLDDPQTEESARSVEQCNDREELISKAVLGLAGPDKRIAALMACTIIQKDDLSDRILNHNKHPEWQGECMKMVDTWPANKDAWDEYAQIRRGETGCSTRAGCEEAATDYYRQNREAMDKGSAVAWEERMYPGELSGLQHAFNLLIDRGRAAFFSEYQNDPQEAHPALYKITPDIVASKINNTDRLCVPDKCAYLVGMIDINPAYGLNWGVLGFEGNMTGYVVDYGKHPEGESKNLMSEIDTEASAIYRGLTELISKIGQTHYTHNQRRVPITLLLIDCGYEMNTVFRFIDWASSSSVGMGTGIRNIIANRGRNSKTYRQNKAIGRPGNNLHLTDFNSRGRVIVHNADYWRLHAQRSFLNPVGSAGSISLYGNNPSIHRRFADNICSEQLVEFLKGDIADSYNWHMTPGTRNDLLDVVVGCCVAASYAGGQVDQQTGIEYKPAVKNKGAVFKKHEI